MYRPGGFPEYSPKEQRTFDKIIDIAKKVFEQHGYNHIWTPAVEPVDILLKGGDVAEQQIFGLYGLAQGPEDTKDYALHFDLTIPFARYVLDHKNELTFPFSRYQMQPVWRGERTKRGRYKEFWQMDIDTVRPSESNIGERYDIQSIVVMDAAMKTLCEYFDVSIDFFAKISHIGLTKSYLQSLGLSTEQQKQIIKILDNYFKKPHDVSMQALGEIIKGDAYEGIENLLLTKDYTLLKGLEGYDALEAILTGCKKYGIQCEYDICIVRGQNYYSGMVVEWFDPKEIAFGSLAAGGRYDNLTKFIDPKQLFSGVGTSLGRISALIMEKVGENYVDNIEKKYLIINFAETFDDAMNLYKKIIDTSSIVTMYPTAAKLSKQFDYANRAGYTHVVLYGDGEKEKGIFIVKNLQTGESAEYTLDFSYGIIPVYEEEGKKKILMIQHRKSGNRSFPKGHQDPGEDTITTARRECLEEVGIQDIVVDENCFLQETYFTEVKSGKKEKQKILKTVKYYLGNVATSEMMVDGDEIKKAKWVTIEQALSLPIFPQLREEIGKLSKIISK